MPERGGPSAEKLAEDPKMVLPEFKSLSVGTHLQVIPGTAKRRPP